MKIPCAIKAPCLDDANPAINLSSEAPDVNHFYAYGSGPGSILPGRPSGPGGVGPTPGGNWSGECQTENGPITCVASTQEEAILCVERLGQQCTTIPGDPPGDPRTPSGNDLFSNSLQQCTVFCSDGSPFTFQVAAGLFVAESQILADRSASSYACRQAQLLKICASALSNNAACVGQSYSGTVSVTGSSATFSISLGTLPPGVTLSSSGNTALFSGVPTAPGNYTFTLRSSNTQGSVIVRSYTIYVIGFTSGNPTPFVQATDYSFQFTASGGTSPYTFSVLSGVLPTGLSMDSAGLVSGTPSDSTSTNATIKITDASGRTCNKFYLFSGSGVLKNGFQICDWVNVLAQLDGFFQCNADASPAWDGIFDLQTVFGGNNLPLWYFINQSISGAAVAANKDPNYPTPGWATVSCETSVYLADDVFGIWNLWITCADCTLGAQDVWFGVCTNGSITDPSGTYAIDPSSFSSGPATIDIRATSDPCCPSSGTAVGPTYSGAQPARVRIHNYSTFLSALGACPLCDASANPAWDGTCTVVYAPNNSTLEYYPTGTLPPPGLLRPVLPALSIAGHQIANGIAAGRFIIVEFRPNLNWEIRLICVATGQAGNQSIIWRGEKLVGDTAVGVYARTAGDSATPNCLTIESY